ncbi:FAD-dependent oxidoreductase [Streptomyces sp. NPDC008222]|uniref:FAD-dependent oxidoreductase n=1 Tax=Streptomyces sp. NPDC008222 TaxID=3364820 RepID=UPI0036E8DB09
MNTDSRIPAERATVLIVGGSIVGASAALFLAARGITPVLVEKHPAVSTRLRAKLFYPRTMEVYRCVGTDQGIYAVQHSLPPADHAAVVTSLAGPQVRRWPLPAAGDFSDAVGRLTVEQALLRLGDEPKRRTTVGTGRARGGSARRLPRRGPAAPAGRFRNGAAGRRLWHRRHGALLVRPDHVIAWRTTQAAANATTALAEATRRAVRPTRGTA